MTRTLFCIFMLDVVTCDSYIFIHCFCKIRLRPPVPNPPRGNAIMLYWSCPQSIIIRLCPARFYLCLDPFGVKERRPFRRFGSRKCGQYPTRLQPLQIQPCRPAFIFTPTDSNLLAPPRKVLVDSLFLPFSVDAKDLFRP